MEQKWIFEGIKILDFTSGAVGPLTTKHFADHGATVVHIESRRRPDMCRTAGPFKDGAPELDHSAWQPNYNTSKYGLALNMELPRGKEIAWKLINWCDILVEGFTPDVMKKWGMDYQSVRKVKPDIIYFSTCQMGQYGPHAGFRGYGGHAVAVGGHVHMLGWPDRDGSVPWGAYTDYVTPRFAVAGILAALDYRRRTGKGQYIDISQFECGITLLAPVIMDYSVNGRIQTHNGNKVPNAAPHAVYACTGEDRWVAIAVTSDEEWQSFCRVIGETAWTKDPKFQTLMGRKENEDELNTLVEAWTKNYSPEEVMSRMQAAGVPAGVVQTEQDLWEDPQMKHRDHFKILKHEAIGEHHYDGVLFRLSKSPQGPRWAGPVLGQHTVEIFTKFLGMTEDDISNLMAEGVLD